MTRPYHVLFLCTENAARSVFAEAILNREGKGRFVAHSAGSRPAGAVNPLALALLAREGFDTGLARSKSWDEFAAPGSGAPGSDESGLDESGLDESGAPLMDFVFTLCDDVAAEECPFWPGQPVSAHWGQPDPARATGTEAEKGLAYAEAYASLLRRIRIFASLPLDSIDKLALHHHLTQIGQDRA